MGLCVCVCILYMIDVIMNHLCYTFVLQASGVAISDDVVKHYELIRTRRQGEEERERFKLLMMRVSDDQKSIIVDLPNCLKNKDVENAADIFEAVIGKLPPKECRYCLYDCHYVTTQSVKEDLIFIMWYETFQQDHY